MLGDGDLGRRDVDANALEERGGVEGPGSDIQRANFAIIQELEELGYARMSRYLFVRLFCPRIRIL